MRSFVVWLIAVCFVVAVVPALYAQEGQDEKPQQPAEKPAPEKEGQEKKEAQPSAEMMLEAQKYHPMEKGDWWEYKMKFEVTDEDAPQLPEGMFPEKLRMKVTETKKNGCHIEPEQQNPFGMGMARDVVVKDGFILLDAMLGLGSEMKALKLPPKKGEKWESTLTSPMDPTGKMTVRSSIAGIESIETPAGKFAKAVCVVSIFEMGDPDEGMNEQVTIKMWFAPGVGLVKQMIGTPMGSIVLLLQKYQVKSAGDRIIKAALAASELVVIASIKKTEVAENLSEEEAAKLKAQEEARLKERSLKLEKGEAVQLSLVVEKVLKGKLEEKEIVVSATTQIAQGKWVLFLGKLRKEGYPLIGPTLPAQDEILKSLDAIINPPKPKTLAARVEAAQFVVVGKAVVKEDRGDFSYWVFQIDKALKGDTTRTHIDVLLTEGLEFTEGERYILTLKAGEHHGRKLFEVLGQKADEFSEKKLQEYEEALKK